MTKRTDVKNGSEMSLLAEYGIVDINQTLEWIKSNTGISIVDVKKVNEASKAGRIYFDDCGRPLPDASPETAKKAKYLVLPIGYNQKKTGYPLAASFLRASFSWEGAKINTLVPLIDGFIKYAPCTAVVDREGIIKQFNGYFEIVGQGYNEVMQYNADLKNKMNISKTEPSTLGSILSSDVKDKLAQIKESAPEVVEETKEEKSVEPEETMKGAEKKEGDEETKADTNEVLVEEEKPKRARKATSATSTTKKTTSTKRTKKKKEEETALELAIEPVEESDVPVNITETPEENKPLNTAMAQYAATNNPVYEDILDKESPFTDVAKDAYQKLLDKSGWKMGDTDCFTPHIHYLFEKINSEISATKGLVGNGYILSDNHTKCVVNTGLVNKFGHDIFILDHEAGATTSTKRKLEVVSDWTSLTKEGFSKDVIKAPPSPIKFYNNPSELVFTGTLEDFDFSSSGRLAHIIDERRFRFPSRYSSTPADVLASMIISSVVDAVKMAERDFKYIVPIYHFAGKKIQYMAPVYLSNSRKDKPVLAAVIGEVNGFYGIFTVLTINKAYANARLLSRQDPSWLKISG